jgi:hypothetical protein
MQHSAYRMRFEFAVFLGDQNYRNMTRRSYVPYKGPLIHCVVESVVDRSILFLLYRGESKMFKCFQSAGATATMFILPFFSFDILELSCAYKPLGRSVCTLYKSARRRCFRLDWRRWPWPNSICALFFRVPLTVNVGVTC